MKYVLSDEIECTACGEKVSANTARVAGDVDSADCTADPVLLCPVCFIQAKNAAMHSALAGPALSAG